MFDNTTLNNALSIKENTNKLFITVPSTSYLKDGDIMIDIGANIGLVTLTSSSIIGKQGKAYSIEAHPTIFQNLLENIKINNRNNIHTFNIAIGNKTGHVIFSNIRSDTMNSVKLESSDGIQIPIKKLDALTIPLGFPVSK